jgi:hypothetical protein
MQVYSLRSGVVQRFAAGLDVFLSSEVVGIMFMPTARNVPQCDEDSSISFGVFSVIDVLGPVQCVDVPDDARSTVLASQPVLQDFQPDDARSTVLASQPVLHDFQTFR